MTILITCAPGIIGSNRARTFSMSPEVREIRVLEDLSGGLRGNPAGVDVAFTGGTLLDAQAVAEFVDGTDSVVHLAAMVSFPGCIADPVACHDDLGAGPQ